jgi:hypothetical protein
MGNTHKHPSKYTKYTVYLTLKQIHIIHQGGVFSLLLPSSKYTQYTVYLGAGANLHVRISHLGTPTTTTNQTLREPERWEGGCKVVEPSFVTGKIKKGIKDGDYGSMVYL